MSKEAYYFSHDSNAFHDPKILKLRASHGLEGYGFYWALIEYLRNQPEFKISVNDFDDLPFFLNCDQAKCKQMLNKCLDVELFLIEDGKLFSISLLRRMEKYLEISNKRKEAGRKGGLVKQTEANAKQMLSKCLSKTEALKEIKEKESKENKDIKNNGQQADLFAIDEKPIKPNYENDFNFFWNLYPRKVNKALAKKSFLKQMKAYTPKIVIDGLYRYLHFKIFAEDQKLIPHASTWINQERFLDSVEDLQESIKTKKGLTI